MDFTSEIDEQKQTIKIKTNCLLTQNIRKKILSVVALHIKKLHYDRVLIDLKDSSFKPDVPMTGALELTMYMKSIGIPSSMKMAFVFSDAESHRKYFQSVANSSGFNIRYFRNMDDASSWLE